MDADALVAVTRHGHMVGHFIPVDEDRSADLATLKAAGEKLDALLSLTEDEADDATEDFKQMRGVGGRGRSGRREGGDRVP